PKALRADQLLSNQCGPLALPVCQSPGLLIELNRVVLMYVPRSPETADSSHGLTQLLARAIRGSGSAFVSAARRAGYRTLRHRASDAQRAAHAREQAASDQFDRLYRSPDHLRQRRCRESAPGRLSRSSWCVHSDCGCRDMECPEGATVMTVPGSSLTPAERAS